MNDHNYIFNKLKTNINRRNNILSSTRISKNIVSKGGPSKTSSSTKKEVASVSTKDSVVCLTPVVVSVSVSAGIEKLIGDILTCNTCSSSSETSIKLAVPCEESCVGIVVSGSYSLWFSR